MQIRFKILAAALLTGLALSPAATAQSNELSILAGATNPSATVNVSSLASVSGGKSAAVQVDFAHRIKETASGNLYFEVPVTRVFKASVGVDYDRMDVAQSKFFVTPGLRYAFAPGARLSPYVAGGFGFGWFESVRVAWSDPWLSVNVGDGVKPAAGFGGGAEIRISRSVTFRAEVRDFVNCASGDSSRNHVVYSGGFGWRF